MHKHLYIIALALLCALPTAAQVRIKGVAIDAQTNEGIPFATVVLRSQRDTTQVTATITDLNGGYMFEYMKPGPHTLEISCLGYVPLQKRKRVGMPSVGHVLEWADTLQVDAKQIEEVRITGAKPQTADRKVYTFSPVEVKQAQHGHDLLQNLPMLETDMVSGTLRGVGGKSVLLLLNGVAATENEVRTIPPHKIKRTEVYDIPPARYSGVDYVINIVTSELSTGVSGGFNLHSAFTTGFFDGQGYLSIVRGRHKFIADYAVNYRNYNDVRVQDIYKYTLNDYTHSIEYNINEHFGYIYHIPKLKYAYGNLDKQIFEVTLRPNINTDFTHNKGDGIYTNSSPYSEQIGIESHDDTYSVSPSVDLYYWRKLTENDELSVNIATAYFDTKRNSEERELANDTLPVIYDTLSLHNNKSSLIGEIAYTRNAGFMQLNAGYRSEYALLNSNYDNIFGYTNYRSDHLQQYGYVEATGTRRGLLFRLSLGLTHVYTKSIYDNYSKLLFTPKLVLGYTAGSHTVRLSYDFAPKPPSINDLSSKVVYLSRHIISRGNPLLHTGYEHVLYLMYNFNNHFVNIAIIPAYSIKKNNIMRYYEEAETKNGFELLRFNLDKLQSVGVVGQINLTPIPAIRVGGYLIPEYTYVDSEKFSYKGFSLNNQLYAVFTIKNFSLFGQLSIPVKELQGYLISLTEPHSHLQLQYKIKNWQFKAGMLWIGAPSHYMSESVPGQKVSYVSDRNIYNNKNMFTFGVSYHFGKGSDWDYQRKLQNEDTTAPSN